MKLIQVLLIPIAFFYGLILSIRNGLFNTRVFKSHSTPMPSLGIGNLSSGGTGKSIVVDYLISKYHSSHFIAVLSRGYGRKSFGFKIANSSSSAIEIGDEPFQFLRKYQKIRVVVGEDRVSATNKIFKYDPKINLLILDDVMQHRWITPSCLMLTTTYSNPFFNDFMLPSGSLREFAVGVKRAQIIIVTKCPSNFSEQNRVDFEKKCNLLPTQDIFFTKINYSKIIFNNLDKLSFENLKTEKIVLVTGIADSRPLIHYLNSKKVSFIHLKYRDHFNYDVTAIKKIKKEARSSLILTTEKDYGRLFPLLDSNKLFYIPITLTFFSENEERRFNKRIKSFIKPKD